tara:strand:+ start:1579 stop:2931 length:1353 start_codon:yes stop_codon:yes gene_type:complete
MYSIFDIFKIGIGPSSSHTVAPMKAAKDFIDSFNPKLIDDIDKIDIELYGSLAFTGKGHNIQNGLILGLLGYTPESVDSDIIQEISLMLDNQYLNISSNKRISFDCDSNIILNKGGTDDLDEPNRMTFAAYDLNNNAIKTAEYVSVGGGFISKKGESIEVDDYDFLYPFSSCDELLDICGKNNLSIHELVLKNEQRICSKNEVYEKIFKIWDTMDRCIERGLKTKGVLSGGLNLKRRAPEIYEKLKQNKEKDDLLVVDWVNLYAMAVNEENASGGQVVTAPTNGAAGIIPAVVRYYLEFVSKSNIDGLRKFFLTSGAIAILYKKNASISGAEVGCQGEVGVACSMAAAGLVSALGGSNKEIENSAEIAMEHNLGLTCDPIKGLVQIPCIERNAMGAIKAINAARIAMLGGGDHMVSLDEVIKTMMDTGKDMQNIYKETSKGGLAVNVTEC